MKTTTLFLLALSCLPAVAAGADNRPQLSTTNYWTGLPYRNDQRDDVELSIPGADSLDVTVVGRTEKGRDVLRIYYSNMKKSYTLSGDVNETFTVPGDTIKVTFNSNQSRTLSNGEMRVSIAAASPYTKFLKVKAELDEAIRQLSSDGAQYAEPEIGKNLQLFQEISKKLADGADPADLAGRISQVLSDVSESYARISGMRSSVRGTNSTQLAKLGEILAETRDYTEHLGRRTREEEDRYDSYAKALKQEGDELERRKLEFAVRAQTSLIDSLKAQHRSWVDFAGIQEKLLEQLHGYVENIDLLLYVLGINSQVYREAAHAMQLRSNIGVALQALEGLSDLQEILESISGTWREIVALQQQINEIHAQ